MGAALQWVKGREGGCTYQEGGWEPPHLAAALLLAVVLDHPRWS